MAAESLSFESLSLRVAIEDMKMGFEAIFLAKTWKAILGSECISDKKLMPGHMKPQSPVMAQTPRACDTNLRTFKAFNSLMLDFHVKQTIAASKKL